MALKGDLLHLGDIGDDEPEPKPDPDAIYEGEIERRMEEERAEEDVTGRYGQGASSRCKRWD